MPRPQLLRLQLSDLAEAFRLSQLPEEQVAFFQKPAFLIAWVEVYLADDQELYLWAVKQEDKITHIFPYYLRPASKLGIRYRELALIGDRFVGANYLRPLIGEFSSELWKLFLDQTSADWDVLRMDKLGVDCGQRVEQIIAKDQFFSSTISTSCPVIKKVDSLDSFLDRIPARKRRKFATVLKKFETLNDFKFKVVSGPQALEMFPRLIEISLERFKQKKISGAFLDPRFADFHQKILSADIPLAQFALITYQDQVQAFHYYYCSPGQVWYYQGGFNSVCEQISPGVLLNLLMLKESCAEQGQIDYDFLEGQEPYKYDFTSEENFLYEIVYASKFPWVVLLKLRLQLRKYWAKIKQEVKSIRPKIPSESYA